MEKDDNGGSSERDPIERFTEVLNHPLRRAVLRYLVDNPHKTIPLERLADRLIDEIESDQYHDKQRLMIRLQHIHMPKLADHDIVEYDTRVNLLRYNPDAALEAWLEEIQKWTGK